MFCVDTSVLVAALTDEAATTRAQIFFASAEPGELAIDAWVLTEFSSALSIKVRTRQLTLRHRSRVLAGFTSLIADSFDILPISVATFAAAARIADQHALGLRAGDALHLAAAIGVGATLVSFDKRLVEGGTALGALAQLL